MGGYELSWDLDRFCWDKDAPLLEFTTKLGRKLLSKYFTLLPVVEKKWSGILLTNYKLEWLNVWNKQRIRKEA